MSSGWSWFVTIVVIANIVGMLWLLMATARSRNPADGNEAEHRWDGDITELNNPLPRWWYRMFLLSGMWGLGFLVFYPGLGNFAGVLKWSQQGQHAAEVRATVALQAERYARFAALPLEQLAQDADAMTTARSVYANGCSACHGSDARGAPGFPNLTDSDWLYGGDGESLVQTIGHGRNGVMPPWGPVLGESGLNEVVAYVRTLSGAAQTPQSQLGAARFAAFCGACHGADGRGNPALGAPNLTDAVWLYGGDEASIRQSIATGRTGAMPAHLESLGEDRVRLLAAYVLSLAETTKGDSTEVR